MKLLPLLLFSICTLNLLAQEKTITLTIENPSSLSKEATLVTLSDGELKRVAPDFNGNNFSLWHDKEEIPSQYNRRDNPGVYFVIDQLKAKEKIAITLRYNPAGTTDHQYAKRTQAELSHKTGGEFVNREYAGGSFKNVDYLRVPPEHKDHSWFIRYEGPGWESDKVGYRFYLDQRNATDVFGKVTPSMILQNVGQDGFDSYHELQPWGMDVMKVGKSLGLGSIGTMIDNKVARVEFTDSVTCRILENGNVFSSIETRYLGWRMSNRKIDVKSVISIYAGTRLTKQSLSFAETPDNVVTGIVKDKTAALIVEKGDKTKYGYLATWGKQSLNNDELGLAVFFAPDSYVAFTEDEFSHVVKLKTAKDKLTYYFMAAWVKETDGIKTEAAFKEYVREMAQALETPVSVTIQKR